VPLVEIHLLRSIPLFAALPAPTLETLARALEPIRFAAGSVIIRQGDVGDRYYAIARGELSVRRDGVPVVFREVRRTVTVVARTDVELYSLEREPFLLALTGHAHASRSADAIVRQRLDELEAAGNGSDPIDQKFVVDAAAERPNTSG
jgi:CRP-like cAMP-binding protein